MGTKDPFVEGHKFIADLADALGVSFRAVEIHSDVSTYQLVKPSKRQDFLVAGEMGCFQGGATLARVRLFKDARFDDALIVSVHEHDPEVIKAARRLFLEQHYSGVGFSYLTGIHVPNKAELLRRHAT